MGKAKPASQDNEVFETPDAGHEQSQAARPAAKFSGSGGLHVAVWKHKSEQGYDRYSVRIERTYKDDEGYKSTDYLRDGDLLRVQKLISQADDWIEQDKAKFRSGASQDEGQTR